MTEPTTIHLTTRAAIDLFVEVTRIMNHFNEAAGFPYKGGYTQEDVVLFLSGFFIRLAADKDQRPIAIEGFAVLHDPREFTQFYELFQRMSHSEEN